MKKPKITRTPTLATGGITPEEAAAMAEHTKMWIARAFRTDPIEPDKIIPAIKRLYAVANLKEPRVVVVPSPLVMAFAYGASAAIWHGRKAGKRLSATDSATRSATDSATYSATRRATESATRRATASATDSATHNATYSATESATRRATESATHNATHNATYSATRSATLSATLSATDNATESAARRATDSATRRATASATESATESATHNATDSATRSATRSATDSATHNATLSATRRATESATASATDSAEDGAAQACRDFAGSFGIDCARRWSGVYQGGNMWAPWDCYLTAARDILGLRLPAHAAYEAWEQCAIHGGFRVMHEEFCLVSDFPEIIKIDAQNLLHCETGPSHRWRDGWSLYHWHGVRIPAEWIEDRASLTPQTALTWTNIEQRRAACEILGWERILSALNAKTIDKDVPEIGELVEVELPEIGRERFLRVRCGTGRQFALPVPPHVKTALEANSWTFGFDDVRAFLKPEIRT